jgi:Transglycosylase-like domain
MKRRWHRDRRAFYKHRKVKLASLRWLEAITPPGPAVLAAIRECESGGNYTTNTGNGFYGAYQFTLSTWESVGGVGLPSDAPPREQDKRAARLYRELGPGPWPVCGV